MNRVTTLAIALTATTGLALAQAAGSLSLQSGQAAPVSTGRTASPRAGIDLSSLNPAQRTLHTVMVRVQQAGIQGDEISPVSRRIVIGMNYVMRVGLTPKQQSLIDPQVWRTKYQLPKEWDRVKNSGSFVSALANLSPTQQTAIGDIYQRCSVNWDAFAKAAGPNASPARKIAVMMDQQDEYLVAVRNQLTTAQRAEWDRLVSTFETEMRKAVAAKP